MTVYSIWEARFSTEAAEEGLDVVETIWRDMSAFEGYLDHELVRDLDDPGHLLAISRWRSRQRADEVLVEYAGHRNAQRANQLVSEPRRRIIGEALPHPA